MIPYLYEENPYSSEVFAIANLPPAIANQRISMIRETDGVDLGPAVVFVRKVRAHDKAFALA